VAVGHGRAEGPGGGPLGIDVQPLVIEGDVGEPVDLVLRDQDDPELPRVVPTNAGSSFRRTRRGIG
jgi:hypothetical protein